jgi:uncharacterized caspase-like protein
MKDNRLPRALLLLALLVAVVLPSWGKTYIVSVGIADYSGYPERINNLSLTANDARAMAQLHRKNSNAEVVLLTDRQATRSRIKSAMSQLFRRAGKDDIVVFFFSGHGYPGGFCAADGDLLYSDVRRAMAQSKSRSKVIYADACYSGAIRNRRHASSTAGQDKKAGVMLFLSSRTNETSIESRRMQNGFFTTYLLSGLRGKADANRDRVITAKEIFRYVSRGVKELSNDKQHPVMWGSFSDNMPVMQW